MAFSLFSSIQSFPRVASRLFGTSAVTRNQQAPTPNTKELEDLFLSSDNSNNRQPSESSNIEANKKRFSFGINRVELLGGVAADPDHLVSKRGDNYSAFRLFTNVDYRRRDGRFGEQVEVHDIHVFGNSLINYLKKNVKKGNRVYVSGRLHYITRVDGSRKSLIRAEIIQSIAKPSMSQSE